ncbi:hypothetical protein HPP92_017937 [Vanilla planifolia]|uniref:Pentatricopeptide repeat-containing protein n=1 Tax=Vanilla planifolia TaxID=51239 RepID=A0A835ULT2_VANPL|nr:hypothetical protein HPP92_017937 [Vanilla planifolia]
MPPPSSPSAATSSSSPLRTPLQFPRSYPKTLYLPHLPLKKLNRHNFDLIRAQPTWCHLSSSASSSPSDASEVSTDSDNTLLFLLQERKTEEAYELYSRCTHIPDSRCLSRLICQLAYQCSPNALSRANSILRRLCEARLLHRLDSNSMGLLANAVAKSGYPAYALALVLSMLKSGYLPHVKAWSAVVSYLSSKAAEPLGPLDALRLFDAILYRLRRLDDNSALAADSRPDTAAFNAALNAAANLGDVRRFYQLFDEMPAFQSQPDVLTYNVLIKLCARAERKDLLVSVLEKIVRNGLVPCITTMHSLVAAYVGLGDLPMAETLVQAMREGRRDICCLLRAKATDNPPVEVDTILDKLAGGDGVEEPPLLPKTYAPDTRIYTTLMKGYMKAGRADDVVRMVGAMRREPDPASHPDHVTYTTAITALSNAGAMDRARAVFDEMCRAGIPANRFTYNVLLKGYCEQLQLDKAKQLIRSMAADAGIEPDVYSYNILIDGCITVDDNAGALAFFNEMRERGIPPSKVSYTTLMKVFHCWAKCSSHGRCSTKWRRTPG